MGDVARTKLQQTVVETLIDSKSIDLESVSSVLGSFASEAARGGDDLVFIINKRSFWACGNPGPIFSEVDLELEVG
jgi:hypothetical protein